MSPDDMLCAVCGREDCAWHKPSQSWLCVRCHDLQDREYEPLPPRKIRTDTLTLRHALEILKGRAVLLAGSRDDPAALLLTLPAERLAAPMVLTTDRLAYQRPHAPPIGGWVVEWNDHA